MTNEIALNKWLEYNNVQPEDLDEVVHDAAASMASNASNEGLSGQIDFLKIIAGWSDQDIKEAIDP